MLVAGGTRILRVHGRDARVTLQNACRRARAQSRLAHRPIGLNQMRISSTPPRLVALALAFTVSGVVPVITSLAQDITGGSSSELASAADVESRSGRGVFTTPKTVAHHARKLEKKTVARVTVARTQHQTGGQATGGGHETGGGRQTSGGSGRTDSDLGGRPLGDAPRRVAGPEELNKQGDEAFDAGQYDKAVDLYQKAIKQKPAYPEAYLNLSEAYFNLGKFNEAAQAAKTATEQKPDWADAYLALGNAYLKADRSADAVEPLKKALTLEPQNTEVKNALSLVYFDQGVDAYNANKYDEAIATYQQAIAVKYDYAEAYNNLGDAYRRQEKFAEAAEAYKQAVQFKRDYVEAYSNLAWMYD